MLSVLATILGATPPALPKDYYTGIQGLIAVASGSYEKDNAMCCAKGTSGCLVSTQAKGWEVVQQGSQNRSMHRGAGGNVLTWAEPVGKVMLLQPGSEVNSTHKWACSLYCPFTGDLDTSETTIAPEHEKVEFIGKRIVSQLAAAGGTTKSCDGYKWTEVILHTLPITDNIMYVDSSKTPPAPFKSVTKFTAAISKLAHQPPQSMNKSFIDFDASFDVARELDVDMASVHTCKRNKEQCASTAFGTSFAAQFDPWRAAPSSLADVAAARLAAMSRAERAAIEAQHLADELRSKRSAAATATRVRPVFSPSYTAQKQYASRMAQGSTVSAGGDYCCPKEAPACAVQISSEVATEYQDVEGKRVRTEHADGSVIVDDFVRNRTMAIAVQGGVETCVSYCPIPSIILEVGLTGITLPNGTVDKGPAVIAGEAVESFEWSETILKVIKMSTTHFYAKVAANGSAVPVFESEEITPFGAMSIGTSNITWKSFSPGRPPASKFAIAGMDDCPQAKHCESPIPAFQSHRRITRQAHTWEEAVFGPHI